MSRRPTARPASDPRVAAFRILEQVESGAYADRAAEEALAGLRGRERALAMEIAFGCVRLRARLDHELARLADRPLRRLDRPVLLWLRIGLYQLREMRVPDHAAVHEAVAGARRAAGKGPAGYVNGVLRAAVRAGRDPEVFPRLEEDPVGHLSTWGSHPEWLIRRWMERWPVEDVARLVELDNDPPPVTFRLLEGSDCEGACTAAGPDVRLLPLPEWPRSCRLAEGEPAAVLERVPAVVQDPAASAVVDYAGPDPASPVLDACAAPGGKALALARRAPTARPFVVADLSRERLRRLIGSAERLGADVLVLVMDARRPAVRAAGTLLLDAPCTGTGVLRRRPDARWRVTPRRLDALLGLQREMLDACAEVVVPGGLLVYATCSLETEENERQVAAFLERNRQFEREAPPEGLGLPADVLGPEGDLRVLPWKHGTDGSYAARLRRRAA